MSVLVVDDIAASRQQLLEIVRKLGHTALEASSGEAALHLINTLHPDVLLLDLLMPGMDGFEVARAIRQRSTGTWLPVIVLSALQGDEHYAQALASGASDCLLKPVNPAILQAKLRQYQRVLSTQKSLSLLARRQHAIHEHLADAIITIDAEGRVCEFNRAARALFVLADVQDPVGLELAALIGLDHAHLLGQTEVEIGLLSGAMRAFSVSHNSWKLGQQSFCTIALHDLSETRRIERMKDEFLATVSHELRTPLTSILGALGLLAAGAGGALPERALQLAQVAQRNGDRLSRLIDDVLDLTKLEGNRMPLNMRLSDLATLIHEAIHANTGYAQRSGVTLHFDDNTAASKAQVDPDRFLQIMANLLSNAIKHSPKGSTVRVELVPSQAGLHVHVVDQGPGVAPAFRSKLFEKFSQADGSDRRAIGGTGLGLYISRMLVEKMGGSIHADSGATGGATFSVTLPRLVQAQPAPWILCIAQDHQLLERMADWLSELARVEGANNLAAALALVRRLGPPAALLANPQAQGPADTFCAQLLGLQVPARMLLLSDALDAGFAARHGMGWLSASRAPRQEITHRVRSLLADPNQGLPHGLV
jgi:signal transduction histidine kinase/CheY-like chemotaxis protein